jgi:hypothetical protein
MARPATGSRDPVFLDSERSWVVLTEANDFIWPGPDLRPAVVGELNSVAYGFLPPKFMQALRERLGQRRSEKLKATFRTEQSASPRPRLDQARGESSK